METNFSFLWWLSVWRCFVLASRFFDRMKHSIYKPFSWCRAYGKQTVRNLDLLGSLRLRSGKDCDFNISVCEIIFRLCVHGHNFQLVLTAHDPYRLNVVIFSLVWLMQLFLLNTSWLINTLIHLAFFITGYFLAGERSLHILQLLLFFWQIAQFPYVHSPSDKPEIIMFVSVVHSKSWKGINMMYIKHEGPVLGPSLRRYWIAVTLNFVACRKQPKKNYATTYFSIFQLIVFLLV